jgi:predicted nucleotidyltransferase
MNANLRPILSELREQLQLLYGPRLVKLILYGSQARSDYSPGSDIDVLVVLKGNVQPSDEIKRSGDIISNLSLRYGQVISCVFMAEERYAHRYGPLLRNIRREGVSL